MLRKSAESDSARIHLRVVAGVVSLLALGCSSLPVVRAPSEGRGLRYEVAVSDDASQLVIEATVPAGIPPYLGMATGAVPFVRDLHVRAFSGAAAGNPGTAGEEGTWTRVAPTDTFFYLPDCAAHGCRLRYRFALREAARALRDVDRAMALGPDLVEAPPSTWLLRPIGFANGTYRLHVVPPGGTGGVRFATGLFPAADGEPNAFEGALAHLKLAPYTVFGRFDLETVIDAERNVGMHVAVPRALSGRRDELRAWLERSAGAVAQYYGEFSLPHLLVVIAPVDGDAVTHGRTLGNGGASSVVWVGRDVKAESLEQDWVLPHELVHTTIPSVGEDHRWFEEGVATYVEGLARAAAGARPEEAFWGDLFEGLPKGLPHRGDRGLDHSPTWGRRYWGGTLFCFLADMEIRRRTEGRLSLADALRGVARAGGNVSVGWSLERTLAVGDAAVGLDVLRDLYQRMGAQPMAVDLSALWSRLGVSKQDGRVVLDDDAPASGLRRSLTQSERNPNVIERSSLP